MRGERPLLQFSCSLFLIRVNLYYLRSDSLNFAKHIGVENASLKSPQPPLEKGGEGGISGIAWL